MNSVNILKLSDKEIVDIMSCLHQHSKISTNKKFHSIMVLFPDIANELFNSETPPNAYCIKVKLEDNFSSKEVLEHAKRIWNAKLIPIEITGASGSMFYAIPQESFFSRDLREIVVMYAEVTIPTVEDFYHDD